MDRIAQSLPKSLLGNRDKKRVVRDDVAGRLGGLRRRRLASLEQVTGAGKEDADSHDRNEDEEERIA